MKKIRLLFILLLMILGGAPAYSQIQQIKIVNFTVKNQLPASIDNWTTVPGSLLLVAQLPPTVRVNGIRLIIQIRANGAIVCSNNAAGGLQVDNFTTRTFNANELTGSLTGCADLKDGSYTICAQFFNIDRVAISNEVCKEFTVETPKETDYAPPTLITPENGKRFLKKDMLKPVMFRWTPLVPKPKEPVTYRLKVWQLMQGQNGTQAMRSNQPIVTKDVDNLTQAVITNLYTGPCKPPYLCDFIWTVQAVNREGKPMGRNNGTSEPYTFKILDDNINTKIDSVDVGCCEKGKQSVYVKVSNLHLTNQAQVVSIKYRVNGTGPLTTLSPTTPAIPFLMAPNSSQAFTALINCVDSMKTIKFIVETVWPTDPDNINNETAWDTLHCRCDACDEKNFILKANPPGNINISNNTISYSQPITVTTTPAKTIKTIQAELVYFEMVPENDMCIPCNKDAAAYGHFTNATNSLEWNGPQTNLNIAITTPQLTPCCSAVFRWCIRYKITFTDCTTCNKLVCYEKKKDGCDKVNPDNNQK
jgi:hypothetical protein